MIGRKELVARVADLQRQLAEAKMALDNAQAAYFAIIGAVEENNFWAEYLKHVDGMTVVEGGLDNEEERPSDAPV